MRLTALRHDRLSRSPPALALSACLTLALAVPAADGAGYAPRAQAIVIALAGAALLAAVSLDERRVLSDLVRGPIVLLAGFGLLSMISAAWTLGQPADSLRWGLVVLSYAALALAGAALARERHGILLIAGAVAGLALVEAVIGLSAAALRELPNAERIAGSWHPGGTFQYSSALALLQVMALPVLLSTMTTGGRAAASVAALGCALALGTVLLAESRIELAMAAAVGGSTLLSPARTTRAPRAVTIAGLMVTGGAGFLIARIVGGHTTASASAGGTGRLVSVAAIALAAGLCWPALRGVSRGVAVPSLPGRGRATTTLAVGAVLCAIALTVVAGQSLAHGRGVEPYGGILHGRGKTWHAALDAFAHRPLLGGGSDTFLTASIAYQGSAPVRYAHDLPLEAAAELGALGGLLVIGLYLACGAAAWRARNDPRAWLVAPGMIAFLVANLVDWEWHLPLSAATWALSLGAVLALSPRRA